MAIRQELLYYVKGDPAFNVDAEYTDIPKILRGYYKEVNGRMTENLETQQVRERFGQATCGWTFSRCSIGWRRMSPAAMRRSR